MEVIKRLNNWPFKEIQNKMLDRISGRLPCTEPERDYAEDFIHGYAFGSSGMPDNDPKILAISKNYKTIYLEWGFMAGVRNGIMNFASKKDLPVAQ